jgi:hypothetical protein
MSCERDHFNHALPLVHMIILVPSRVEFNKIKHRFFFKRWILQIMLRLGQIKKICVFTVTRPTLTFFIGNYSTLIFASDPINFYTEFG